MKARGIIRGCKPQIPFSVLRRENPEAAKALFLRLLYQQVGSVEKVAQALCLTRRKAFYLAHQLGLTGLPRKIRETNAQRFRLPAA